MKIGIDLDGVLFDSERMFRSASAIFNESIGGQSMKFPEEIEEKDRYCWTDEQNKEFLDNNLMRILRDAPVMHDAKFVLKCLKDAGNEIYVITGRGGPGEIELTKKRFKEENLHFDGENYLSDKLAVSKKLGIDIFIEDNWDTVERLSKGGIQCLYYRENVLKLCKNENVTEVRNWGEIYAQFRKRGII